MKLFRVIQVLLFSSRSGRLAAVSFSMLLAGAPLLRAGSFELLEPTADRWMYPFNGTPGTRPAASVFGAIGEASFDDRDAQFLVRFDTTSVIAAGLGAGNYSLTSLQLTLTVNVGDSFRYDPTYDGVNTYLDPTASGYVADTDLGRPIELFAVGYRNGYSTSTFTETSPFGSATESGRNAYAAGFNSDGTLIDVSNNVASAFDVTPFAIGQVAGLTSGSFVPQEAQMTFSLNLSDPLILAYLQESLNAGYLEFMVTSLQATTQEAASGFPSFFTKDNLLHDPAFGDYLAGQLTGEVTAVPEPATWLLLGAAGLAFGVMRRGRRG